MDRTWFLIGSIYGLFGVAAGAFGAHILKDRLTPEYLDVFETAARYQVYHALALLAMSYAATRWGGWPTTAAGWLFTIGVVLFSGSLYLLSISGIRWLGAITPLGGVCLLAGWAMLIIAVARGQ
ncbi:MAG: DUF423 domain-containing protein [Dehalococcoidia bacterium]|nr:DUF423 domain-containing protein [Dehalococcoidia bacterium]